MLWCLTLQAEDITSSVSIKGKRCRDLSCSASNRAAFPQLPDPAPTLPPLKTASFLAFCTAAFTCTFTNTYMKAIE